MVSQVQIPGTSVPLQCCQENSTPHCIRAILHYHMGSKKIEVVHWVGSPRVGLDSRNAKTFQRYGGHDLRTQGLIHYYPLSLAQLRLQGRNLFFQLTQSLLLLLLRIRHAKRLCCLPRLSSGPCP